MSAAVVFVAASALDGSVTATEYRSAAEVRSGLGQISAGTAFYRKYTERLLRRYMRTSFNMGRSPSVLGNFAFPGKSSHSRTRNFEDAVIFVHDVETCINKLDAGRRDLIGRIALQDHTQEDVAQMLSTSVRSVMRRYAEALDRLTEILLEVDLLDVS